MNKQSTGHGPDYDPDSRTPWTWPPTSDVPDLTAQRQSDEDVAASIERVKRQLSQRGNQRVLIVPKGQQ